MTTPTLIPAPAETLTPRPGSRAARLAQPRAVDALKDLAIDHGVCIRPIALRRTDLATGKTELVDLPCGATLEAKCPPCAKRARRLRQVQIREGWHRADEPLPGPAPATPRQRDLITARAHLEFERAALQLAAMDPDQRATELDRIDTAIGAVEQEIAAEGLRGSIAPGHNRDAQDDDEGGPRRVRSTKRRQDVPDLPRQKVEARTVGRTYVGSDGVEHRPSMWLTLTLDSYGPVHSIHTGRPCSCRRWHTEGDPLLGTPVDPSKYDYRRAAWDAVHFPRLLDRYWQNLRRAVGWNVQYAGCVEPQRRLAPHAHFAIRGTIPRAMLELVATATYHQVWWPAADRLRYPIDRPPTWDSKTESWVDPDTGRPLSTWGEALDAIDDDPDAEPAHLVRFGAQVKAKGVDPGTRDAERTIGYITKYVTKSAADCHQVSSDPQRQHLDRLWHELRVTPCSERCSNWLLYGVQPKKAHGRLRPGHCKGRVHQKTTLGIGGRRVLVSRDWSGKTLADHRADAHAWVKALLGITTDEPEPDAAEKPAVAWEMARHDDPDLPALEHRLLRAISERIHRRAQLNAARQRVGSDPPNSSDCPSGLTREVTHR
ncbi:replication initiation protein [Actinoplanes hulinensis]|uniref:Replication initiation protein n=1 Tax=Actinoplanes hulinensis TaxID=1144547 RepID=A0ABS7BB54_9ACTN|nr:replication initiator [Actinoplanes hulinensis]MBW6437664.1 replication initiation protein [Actinoplanes hulinensis]